MQCDDDIRPAPSGAGFTLVELAVAGPLLGLLVYVVMMLTNSGNQSQQFAQRQMRVTEVAQDVVDDMRRELRTSVRLFQDDADGAAYLAALDTRAARPASPFRLPRIDAGGVFGPETAAAPRTGNALLLARHAWTTVVTLPSSRTVRLAVYRLGHYYPSTEGAGPAAGSTGGLNLTKWVSEPLVDGDQIDAITDPADQVVALQHLLLRTPDDDGVVHPRAEVVWRRNESVATVGTLRQILADGSLSSSPVAPRGSPWRVQRDPAHSSNRVLRPEHHALASVFAPARLRIGTFSTVSTAAGGFPHGLEIQVVGPASARQVLVRLVLVTTNAGGHPAHATVQTIAHARDL